MLAACEKDPYPSVGGVRQEARDEQRDVPETISMTVEKKYEFNEGKRSSFKVGVFVQAPGRADLVVKNLPQGAEFDPATFTISWLPGPYQGNDVSDPTKKTRVYNIELLLRNAADIDGETRTASVTLVVNDVPRKFEINGRDTQTVYEGETLSYDFEMDNIDYPNGPFAVNTADMPANTKLIQLDDKRYRVKFSPDHHHVKINERREAEYESKIRVYNPANHLAEKTISFTVKDKRLGVKLVTPPEMEQGLDSTFQVSAYDLNGEVAPRIELDSRLPEYGEFSTQLVKDEQNNSSVLNVVWKDIPPSYNGTTQTFQFRTCVLNQFQRYSNCKTGSTRLKIKVKDRKPPVFSRYAWEPGEIKYLKFDERDSFVITAKDGDNSQTLSNLEVVPTQMKKYVSYSNGKVYVKADKPGIHQFSLVAKSEYNMTTAESFVFEVFKPERSEILYFTDSTRDAEVKFFKENLNNVELMNPAIQILNDRNLSGRHTLVLGTSVLYDTQMQQQIATGIERIQNIIIASPMVENLPKSFLDMIEDRLKITVLGRYSQLPTNTPLKDLYFVSRADFASARDQVGLKGSASSESADPIIFHEGVEARYCDDVLELNDDKSIQKKKYTVGIICRMPNGGRLALLGTEFADLRTSQRDQKIPASWFQNMRQALINR